MRSACIVFSLIALIGAVGSTPVHAQSVPDAKAIAVADEVMTALGGRDAWDGTRFIRFTFVRGETVLKLTWDKWDGRYRLDATTSEGQPYVVLMNVNTKQGDAYVAGEKQSGEALAGYLDGAFRIWEGEIYWFLMPFKLRDPGVTLQHDGQVAVDDITYDVLHLSFEQLNSVGNEFWVYVNPTTHLVDRWKYLLGGRNEGEFLWTGWERHGPLMVSTLRETVDGTVAIRMTDITISNDLPDTLFTSPNLPSRD